LNAAQEVDDTDEKNYRKALYNLPIKLAGHNMPIQTKKQELAHIKISFHHSPLTPHILICSA